MKMSRFFEVPFNGKGIDLPGSLAVARSRGINSLDAFNKIVDRVVENNGQYKALEEKAKTAKGVEKQQSYESMSKILEGSAIGQIIADRQALMALIGYRSNRPYVQSVGHLEKPYQILISQIKLSKTDLLI